MSAMGIPTDSGIALAWLRCAIAGAAGIGAIAARVTVLKPVNSPEPAPYFRRTPNPGSDIDMGNSSGTNFASFSASSYST